LEKIMNHNASLSLVALAAFALAFASSDHARAAAMPDTAPGAACRALGLDPGELQFDDCVATLNRAVTATKAAMPATRTERACAAVGLTPGSTEFTQCSLDLGQTLSDDSNASRG
jgi:hypothetical protein